jgi:hypothetical protein
MIIFRNILILLVCVIVSIYGTLNSLASELFLSGQFDYIQYDTVGLNSGAAINADFDYNFLLDGEHYDVSYYSDDYSSYSEVIFDGVGGFTFNIIQASDASSESGSGTYTVASDGEITIGDNRGVVSSDGEFVFLVDLAGIPGLDLSLEKSSGLSNTILNGEYYAINYFSDDYTEFTEVIFDGVGGFTFNVIQASDASSESGSGTYTVAPDGEIIIGDNRGVVSSDGRFVFLVDLSGIPGLVILIKQSSGLTTSILNGEYYSLSHFSDDFASFGEANFDGNGAINYQQIQTVNGLLDSGSGTYTVASDGEIIIGDNRGVVSSDGEFVFLVDLGSNPGINILARKLGSEGGAVVTGDFNGDSQDDLAEVTTSAQVRYSVDLITWTNITGELKSIVTGDFNDDGNDDIAGVNSIGQVWYTTDLSSWTNIPGTVAAIVTGDLDDDGDDDIAGINPDGLSAKVFYTTDLSSWTPIPGLITSIVTGDLDGDGDDDIAGINPNGVISKIFYTTDLSTWTPIPGLITLIITGDLDGDGDDDIAGINPGGVISKIFYTTDLSTWTPIPGLITSIVAGDFDGDGDEDIAGINPNGVAAKIFYTTDLSTWTIIPGALDQITTGDLDADGDDDLAGINRSTSVTWYTTDLATWTSIP